MLGREGRLGYVLIDPKKTDGERSLLCNLIRVRFAIAYKDLQLNLAAIQEQAA